MGLPILVEGASAGDVEGAPRVVVVNETFARRYLPAENPLGQIFRRKDDTDWEIVGMCRDAKYTDIKNDIPPTVYFSFRQDSVAVPILPCGPRCRLGRGDGGPQGRGGDRSTDSLADITTQEQVRDKRISQERLFATLCSALAGLAILLSCIGSTA